MGENGSDYAYSGKLGRWVSDQRRMKKGTHGNAKLTPDREALLQKLVDQGKYSYICRKLSELKDS
jgi:hypothetical protein